MDVEYLRYKIRSQNMTIIQFADDLGISTSTLYKKMKGKTEWTYKEMRNIKNILNLSYEEFNKVFGF